MPSGPKFSAPALWLNCGCESRRTSRTDDGSTTARLERGLRALRYPDTLTRFVNIYSVFSGPQKRELYGGEMHPYLSMNGIGPSAQHVERTIAALRTDADRGTLTPERPASMASQVDATSPPSGVVAPIPVMTIFVCSKESSSLRLHDVLLYQNLVKIKSLLR